VIAVDAKRIVCSLTNPESFCFDAKFQAKCFVLKLKLENVASPM